MRARAHSHTQRGGREVGGIVGQARLTGGSGNRVRGKTIVDVPSSFLSTRSTAPEQPPQDMVTLNRYLCSAPAASGVGATTSAIVSVLGRLVVSRVGLEVWKFVASRDRGKVWGRCRAVLYSAAARVLLVFVDRFQVRREKSPGTAGVLYSSH